MSGRWGGRFSYKAGARDTVIVWKVQKSASMPIKGGLTRSPGWVIAQYFSNVEDAEEYIRKQRNPENYKIE